MLRIVLGIIVGIGLITILSCESQSKAQATIGSAKIAVPAGWREIKRESERITLASSDDRQQTTISVMSFDTDPTFADFKLICSNRLKAEKAEAEDVVIQPDEPFQEGQTYSMFFSGKEEKAGRLFSGYLNLRNAELITVYVESIGVDSKSHFQSFETFVKTFQRNK